MDEDWDVDTTSSGSHFANALNSKPAIQPVMNVGRGRWFGSDSTSEKSNTIVGISKSNSSNNAVDSGDNKKGNNNVNGDDCGWEESPPTFDWGGSNDNKESQSFSSRTGGRYGQDDEQGFGRGRGGRGRGPRGGGRGSRDGGGRNFRDSDGGGRGFKDNDNGGRRFGNADDSTNFIRGERNGGQSDFRNGERGRGRGGSRGRGGGGFSSNGYASDEDATSGGGFRRGGFSSRGGRGGGGRNHDSGRADGFEEDSKGDDERPKVPLYIPPAPPEDEETIFAGIPSGINFSKYQNIPVKVSGNNAPRPIQSFEESGLRSLLLENVRKSNYTVPTPVQKYSIPVIMANRDVMTCAQTGSGKTAAFLLPILHNLMEEGVESASFKPVQEPYVVVMSPTRELAVQIFMEARKFSMGSIIKSAILYGGVSTGHQMRNLEMGCHVLIATPGRLHDFVGRGKVAFTNLRYLVLDEADRMLDQGFKPEIEKMVSHSTMPPKGQRRTLMFSATLPEEVQKMARDFLDDYLFLAVGMVGGANADVEQKLHRATQYEKREKLLELLTTGERVMVFLERKRNADFLASYLCQNGFKATSIHGDRFQSQREEALSDFKHGRMQVLVATSVASRGLDIKDVAHVVNYDLPQSIEEYVHRIGRTGRVGNLGRATSFYDPTTDSQLASSLLKILASANQEVPEWLEEEASTSGGGPASGYGRGRFGGSDIRSHKEIRGNAVASKDEHWNNTGSGQATSVQGLEEEESWD